MEDNPRTLTYNHKKLGIRATSTFTVFNKNRQNLRIDVLDSYGDSESRELVASEIRDAIKNAD